MTASFKNRIWIISPGRIAAALVISMAFILSAAPATSVLAADAAGFYKGKNLVLVVPYKPGGGYDTWGRLLAPYLSKYTGARTIVKNMPGAGGMLGINEVYNAAPNGLTINIQNAVACVTNQIAEVKGVRYDLLKYSWIGRTTTDRRVLAMRKDATVKTIQDLIKSKKPIKIGATGLGGSTYVDAVISKKALNLPIEIIHGYDSSSEIDLGLLRGEIDGTYGSYSSRLKMVKGGEQFIILQSGSERSAQLTDIPTWFEMAPSEHAKEILSVLDAMHATGRPLAAPPGTPADRLAFLRQAFDKTMRDPDFLKSAKKAKREVDYLSGRDMEKLVQTSLNISDPEIRKIFVDAIKGDI